MSDYIEKFITEADAVKFTTPDGRRWQMRQPTPEEASNALSAYRLAEERILSDRRLAGLAADQAALEREARTRAMTAQAIYLLPMLLLDEHGQAAFDVFDQASMDEFENLDQAVLQEFFRVLWGPVQQAISEAKKKSAPVPSNGTG